MQIFGAHDGRRDGAQRRLRAGIAGGACRDPVFFPGLQNALLHNCNIVKGLVTTRKAIDSIDVWIDIQMRFSEIRLANVFCSLSSRQINSNTVYNVKLDFIQRLISVNDTGACRSTGEITVDS